MFHCRFILYETLSVQYKIDRNIGKDIKFQNFNRSINKNLILTKFFTIKTLPLIIL